ncbi:MAG: zinc ribbon domain-containing protein [Acetobacterium sp.]|nr:zinc ribbon domain-containing protein [Acetobacterium sp.]
MPVKSLFGKIKENTTIVGEMVGETVSGIIKDGVGKKNAASGKKSLNAIKNELTELLKEKSKMFGVLGREAYDLYQDGNMNMGTLEGYFKKVAELDVNIESLRKEKELVEKQNQIKRTCDCGKKLDKNDKFCPDCGAKIDDGTLICSCGNIQKNSEKFCNICGENIQDQLKIAAPAVQSDGRLCVCGAIISVEQDFCGECGRL